MLHGTNLEYTKAYNYRIVLETIRLHGPLSRAEVARTTGLTAQTVSNITKRLLDENLILETDRTRVGRGAPATNLEINPDGAFTIGLDLDEKHLTGVLIDLEGNLRQRLDEASELPDPITAMSRMESMARQLTSMQGIGLSQIWGVGIGLPGPLEVSTLGAVVARVEAGGLSGWHDVPVLTEMESRLRVRVALENNATAAAVAERWYGEGRDIGTFFYLFFGLGLGGGLVIDGRPYEGHSGNAGEIGFVPAPFPNDGIRVFDDPHLGIYFNLPRLERRLNDAGVEVKALEDLVTLLEARHPVLLDWLQVGAERLADVIPVIAYVVDPQAIIFGGRLPDELIDALLERVETALPARSDVMRPFRTRLIRGRAGRDATALGVATLPMYEAFAPTHDILLKSGSPRAVDLRAAE